MQFKLFTVSVLDTEPENEKLNQFLSSHKVIEVDKQLISLHGMHYWTFCVKYLIGEVPTRNNLKYPEKIDYREVLSENEFKRFANFRTIRKQLADSEALPAFAIFTDAELAEMAKFEILTKATMLEIKGIGEKKMQKYGEKFLTS